MACTFYTCRGNLEKAEEQAPLPGGTLGKAPTVMCSALLTWNTHDCEIWICSAW